ncbi:MAG: DUF1656 domain-containing protein [Gammaproteobacteria bacterium]|nr:MAG: DUF1656 domain-containing protein [Gammaproteobacteria bacterium]
MNIPHEFAIGGVYMSPLLIASLLGFIAALVIVRLLNYYKLSKYFFYPPIVMISLIIINTVIFSTFLVKG